MLNLWYQSRSSLGWREGCGFFMSHGFKYSSLVELVCGTKSFKNKKRVDKVMRVHTQD